MTKHMTLAMALAAIMAVGVHAQAVQQNRQAGATTPTTGAPGGQAQTGQLDQAIAACLLLGNQEEVALAQFAESRAKNPRVKEFATTMQRDHTQAIQKLQRVVPQTATWNLQLTAADGAPRPGAQPGVQQAGAAGQFNAAGAGGVQQATATQPAAGGVDPQMIALQRTIAEQCLALTQKELDEAGQDFDQAYIGQQCAAHVAMLAKLKGSEQFASGELRNFIQEATRTVEGHLQMVKAIKKELKSAEQTAGASAQRTVAPVR